MAGRPAPSVAMRGDLLYNVLCFFIGNQYVNIHIQPRGECMKCKKCGRELVPGAKKCPYCGTNVPAPGSRASEEFKWNVQDFPKPGSDADFQIDWGAEKIVDKNSGRTYFQKENTWKEPEEVKEMFSFDEKLKELQNKVDEKVDEAAAEKPRPALEKHENSDLFNLPDDVSTKDLSELLGIEDEKQENENVPGQKKTASADNAAAERPAPPSAPDKNADRQEGGPGIDQPEFDFGRKQPAQPAPNKNADRQEGGLGIDQPEFDFGRKSRRKGPAEKKQQHARSAADEAYDPFSRSTVLTDRKIESVPGFLRKNGSREDMPAGTDEDSAGKITGDQSSVNDPGYTAEEEKKALENFENLISAEETFSDSMNKLTHLTEEEEKQVERASRRREKLTDIPQMSFRTIEDEYERYREHSRKAAEEEAVRASEEEKNKAESGMIGFAEPDRPEKQPSEEKTESSRPHPENINRKESKPDKTAGAAGSEHEDSPVKKSDNDKKKSRQVNVKINEPSGTKFTVRTQEVNLADQVDDKTKTRPVDLEELKQGPKGVQVHVEVDSKNANSSVEVTRNVNGSTVIKTLEDGRENVHTYGDDAASEKAEAGRNVGSRDDKAADAPDKTNHEEEEEFVFNKPEDEKSKNLSFWEKKGTPATRMTITDIFSSDVKDFSDQWEGEEKGTAPDDNTKNTDKNSGSSTGNAGGSEKAGSSGSLFKWNTDADGTGPVDNTAKYNPDDMVPVMPEEETPAETVSGQAADETPVMPDGEAPAEIDPDPAGEETSVPEEKTAEAGGTPDDTPKPDHIDGNADGRPGKNQESEAADEPQDVSRETSAEEEEKAETQETPESYEADDEAENKSDTEQDDADADSGKDEGGISDDRGESRNKSEAEKVYDDITLIIPTDEIREKTEAEDNQNKQTSEDTAAEEDQSADGESTSEAEGSEPVGSDGDADQPEDQEVSETEEKADDDETSEADTDAGETDKEGTAETAEAASDTDQAGDKGDMSKMSPEELAEKLRFEYIDEEAEDNSDRKAVENTDDTIRISEETRQDAEKETSVADVLETMRDKIQQKFGKKEEKEADPEQERAVREFAEKNVSTVNTKNQSTSARIMKIAIIVLIVAIILEFTIIGVKLFAPDSQGAVFINRIERSIAGSEYTQTAYSGGTDLTAGGQSYRADSGTDDGSSAILEENTLWQDN